MAELDYAFLADYARAEANGCLTVVGASFTFLETPVLPRIHRMFVAGRVKGTVDEPQIPIRLEMASPDNAVRIGLDAQLALSGQVVPYQGNKIGHLFAIDVQMPLTSAGLYEANIYLADRHVRRLAFEVLLRPPAS